MARIRSIHPDFPSDKKLAGVSRDARLTYALTWCIADDAGLFRANPRQLLGQLYPYDVDVTEAQLEAWLVALVGLGVIRWHSTKDGARVGQLVNWPKRQKIDKPSKSFLQAEIVPLAEGSCQSSTIAASDTRGLRDGLAGHSAHGVFEPGALSLESGALSLEPRAALRARLPVAAHDALDGYLRGAPYPDAVVQTILAEGPDTGTNGAAGKTWEVIGQALIDLRGAGKPFTPALLRAFVRKLLEVPPTRLGETPADSARRTADELERKAKIRSSA